MMMPRHGTQNNTLLELQCHDGKRSKPERKKEWTGRTKVLSVVRNEGNIHDDELKKS